MSIPLRVKNRIKHGWRHLVRMSVWKPHDYRMELLDFIMDHVLTPWNLYWFLIRNTDSLWSSVSVRWIFFPPKNHEPFPDQLIIRYQPMVILAPIVISVLFNIFTLTIVNSESILIEPRLTPESFFLVLTTQTTNTSQSKCHLYLETGLSLTNQLHQSFLTNWLINQPTVVVSFYWDVCGQNSW